MYMVIIDLEKCEGCGDCVDTCPNEVIKVVEEDGKKYATFTGSPDDCIGCLSCQELCEQGAITVTEL